MRIYPPDWAIRCRCALKCLTIDTHCTLCGRSAQPGIDLCNSCQQLFKAARYTDRHELTTLVCPGCGLEQVCGPGLVASARTSSVRPFCQSPAPSGLDATGDYCAACASAAGRFFRCIIAPYRYAFPVDKLLKRLKYGGDRQLARVLGTLLADAALIQHPAGVMPDVVVPMPLHPGRLRHRGFNQAKDIAFWCAKRLGLCVQADQVSRIVDTGSLAGLNREERQLRILGAFRAGNALTGKKVVIVDDVMTTGASARELAREIYDSGAESVELWVLARTSSRRAGTEEI